MNGCRAKYSSLAAATLLAAGVWAGQTLAEPTPQPSASPMTASPVTADALAEASAVKTTPTFAQMPVAPTDVRGFQAWRGAITDLKAVGAQTESEGAAGPWLLADTEDWAERARAEAAPPAPMTTPAQGDTDAFVRDMIRRATPPPRAH
jgi:hypothetical protein